MRKRIVSMVLFICILVSTIYTNTEIQAHGETFDYYAKFRLDYEIQSDTLLVNLNIDEFNNVGKLKQFRARIEYDDTKLLLTDVIAGDNLVDRSNISINLLNFSYQTTPVVDKDDLITTLKFKILNDTTTASITIFEIDITGTINDPYYDDEGTVNSPSIEVDLSSGVNYNYGAVLQLTSDKTTYRPGDEVLISVGIKHLNDIGGITSFELIHNYDTNVFECIEIIEPENFMRYIINTSNGRIICLMRQNMSIPPIESGYICKVKYKVLSDAKPGEAIIGFKDTGIANQSIGKELNSEDGEVNEPSITLIIQDLNTIPPGDSPTFKIDYKNHQLIIPTDSNTMFFLGVEDKKGDVKSYEMYDADGTTTKIPLSSFSTSKEWKLKLKGNIDTTPVDITLTTGAKKVKAVYISTEATLEKRIKFTHDTTEIPLNKLEYRTASTQWLDASTLSIKQLDAFAVNGATLIFRIKAVEDGNPYSSEAKMKIPKLANAPKVTINYSQLTVKFPAGSEYRLQHSGTWAVAPTAVTNIKDLTNINNTNFYLEVRKAASNGKVASKIGITTVDSQIAGPTISTNGVLEITYSLQTGTTTSVKIKNTSVKDIEYAIISEGSSIDLTKQKWKKLIAGGEATLKKNDSNGKIIIARYVSITGKNVPPQFASKISYSTSIKWNE